MLFRSAKAYLETLKTILIYLGISDGKMQEGSIRCDVNVSVREKGSDKFGTRVEMKNVNSFSGAMRAIDYESARQIEVIENGGIIEQETRRWDDAKGMSIAMRTKENANDYRYFPEPDLGTIYVPEGRDPTRGCGSWKTPHWINLDAFVSTGIGSDAGR